MDTAHPIAVKSTPAGNRWFAVRIASVAALGGLLFGYDTAVISGAIGLLQRHFQLSPAATGWVASCALAGCVLGAAFAGKASDAFGRRAALLLSSIAFLVSAVGTAMASGVASFVVFRIIGGLGIGAAAMVSPMYIAEVSPPGWRGRLVTLNQLALVFGMLLIYFVNYRIANLGSEEWNLLTGWRWMFASGVAPALLLFVMLPFVPETPRFLMSRGREREARSVMTRIEGASVADAELRQMYASQHDTAGKWTSRDVRRMGLIGVLLAVFQQVSGINVFLYYAPELFKNAGAGSHGALLQTVILGAINVCFTVISMAFVDRLGRKPLWVWGSIGWFLLPRPVYRERFVGLRPYLHSVFCLLRRTRDLGDFVRDISHTFSRTVPVALDRRAVDRQLYRVSDFSDPGPESLAEQPFSPRIPLLSVRRLLLPGGVVCRNTAT